jgi:cytidylate kinase
MAKRVVCISRTLGAGGEEVAQDVAAGLAFRYIDDEIIALAAEKAGVSAAEVAKAEQSQPMVSRILETLAAAPMMSEGGYVAPALIPVTHPFPQLIERVIRETAEAGNVVIVAHGASHPLAGTDDVLRVLITAAPAARTARVASENGLDASAARKAVEKSDRERAKYLERFYNVREEDPTHYDLTINTDAIPVPTAVALVIAAART